MSATAAAEMFGFDNKEVIAPRERLYVDVSLDTHEIFCFDERGIAEAETHVPGIEAATPDAYIHWAGGGLNIVFNQAVIDEANKPFSVTDSFERRTSRVVPVLFEAGLKPGVHSDVTAEGGNTIRPTPEGPVGCGYGEKRSQISLWIAENGTEVVRDAADLRPELFDGPDDHNFAHAVVAAHSRLVDRPGFITDGRRVVIAAAVEGSRVMLVEGEHTGTVGVFNLVPGTSFDSHTAAKEGLEAYSQDSWAVEEANDRLRHKYPYDKRQQQIAELIDGIGTMRALGVEDIVVRRPE